MEKIVLNPDNHESQYLDYLNECFPNWGGTTEYDWVFERKVGAFSADILLIENEEDGVIAGSAVSYRKLSQNGQNAEIGIMTGSWTLPAARRKGCFGKMIETSVDLCKKKNVPYLTAFVTETNPSCRRLRSAGSFMFPTYHLFSPEQKYEEENIPQQISNSEKHDDEIFKSFQEHQSKFLSFEYNQEEFLKQYIQRPKHPVILKINGDFAILEDGKNEIKILLITFSDLDKFRRNLKSVTNWCLENKGKKAFFFTTREELYNVCMEENFENLPGFFTILKTSGSEEIKYTNTFKALNINMADKM